MIDLIYLEQLLIQGARGEYFRRHAKFMNKASWQDRHSYFFL